MTTPTGRVISRPPQGHSCDPGWTYQAGTDGTRYGIPPLASEHPKGTVWACSCGRTWVSLGAPWNSPISLRWKPEGRLARWRRTRKAAAR